MGVRQNVYYSINELRKTEREQSARINLVELLKRLYSRLKRNKNIDLVSSKNENSFNYFKTCDIWFVVFCQFYQ